MSTHDSTSGPTTAEPLLSTDGLSVSFGGVKALKDVSLRIERGMVAGLIGANGAGKTTLIDSLTGFVPSRGTIRFGGRDLSGLAPHLRVHRGLARTWQSVELFESLTVAENVEEGVLSASDDRSLRGRIAKLRGRDTSTAARTAMQLMGVEELGDRLPHELSHGHRKLVGVARALASEPDLVCLDEPAAGLDTTETSLLGDRIRAIAASGRTVLLVDHDMSLVFEVCTHVFALDFGHLIASGTPEAIRTDECVLAAYLGSEIDEATDLPAAKVHTRPDEVAR